MKIKINNFQTVEAKRILKTCSCCHREPVEFELVKNKHITIGKTTNKGIICDHCYAKKFKTYCSVFHIKTRPNHVIKMFIYHDFISYLNIKDQNSFYVNVYYEDITHTFFFNDYLCEVFSFKTFTEIMEKQIKKNEKLQEKNDLLKQKIPKPTLR